MAGCCVRPPNSLFFLLRRSAPLLISFFRPGGKPSSSRKHFSAGGGTDQVKLQTTHQNAPLFSCIRPSALWVLVLLAMLTAVAQPAARPAKVRQDADIFLPGIVVDAVGKGY